jgi:prolipoprotein diacylglyceryltransferase
VIAFYLPGNIPVYAYAILVGLGVVIGLIWVVKEVSEKQTSQMLDISLWALGGSLVGSRLAYLAINWDYFRPHLIETFQFQLGGLSWLGGLAGWFVSILIYCIYRHEKFSEQIDKLMPLAACILVAIWLACWVDGVAYGRATDSWWAISGRDEWGVFARRVPLQIFGAISTIAIFWLLDYHAIWRKSKWIIQPGVKTLLAVIAICMQLWVISFFRADISLSWHELRVNSWMPIVIIVCVLMGWLIQVGVKLWQKTNGNNKVASLQENTK